MRASILTDLSSDTSVPASFFLIAAWLVIVIAAISPRRDPLRIYGKIDAIVPCFNEEVCLVPAIEALLANPYFNRVIAVNDGSTDRTAEILDEMATKHARLTVVHQANTGKGGALMNGISHSRAALVFLSDADTAIDPEGDALGYLMAEMKAGADAVGGIPLSNLAGAGVLPHARATTKIAVIIVMRSLQQLIGGAPFLISGACGLFKRSIFKHIEFSDRTKVEDLDLTWTLVTHGYKVRQANRCFVYSQEANSLKSEWRRWRRWIAGYGVCMRLHRKLLLTRFGIGTILPVFLSSMIWVSLAMLALGSAVFFGDWHLVSQYLHPLAWVPLALLVGAAGAFHHRKPLLVLLTPATLVYVFMCYAIWLLHGIPALFTGREPARDKPQRYVHVVA